MFTLSAAKKHAVQMSELHREPWMVFKVPESALCNQSPFNVHNSGQYAACRASERNEYEQGGALFLETCLSE